MKTSAIFLVFLVGLVFTTTATWQRTRHGGGGREEGPPINSYLAMDVCEPYGSGGNVQLLGRNNRRGGEEGREEGGEGREEVREEPECMDEDYKHPVRCCFGSPPDGSCRSRWTSGQQRCYGTSKTWEDAQRLCDNEKQGGHLCSPEELIQCCDESLLLTFGRGREEGQEEGGDSCGSGVVWTNYSCECDDDLDCPGEDSCNDDRQCEEPEEPSSPHPPAPPPPTPDPGETCVHVVELPSPNPDNLDCCKVCEKHNHHRHRRHRHDGEEGEEEGHRSSRSRSRSRLLTRGGNNRDRGDRRTGRTRTRTGSHDSGGRDRTGSRHRGGEEGEEEEGHDHDDCPCMRYHEVEESGVPKYCLLFGPVDPNPGQCQEEEGEEEGGRSPRRDPEEGEEEGGRSPRRDHEEEGSRRDPEDGEDHDRRGGEEGEEEGRSYDGNDRTRNDRNSGGGNSGGGNSGGGNSGGSGGDRNRNRSGGGRSGGGRSGGGRGE